MSNNSTENTSTDPTNVIVTHHPCSSCGVDAIQVHHQTFPEMRVGGTTAGEAAERLANQLQSSLDVVVDPWRRELVVKALADIRAFLNREGPLHVAREL